MAGAPMMVVTASIDPAVRAAFDEWHRDIHLPRVLRIPGIERGWRLTPPRLAPNYAAVYLFREDARIQEALASPEAQEARRDWERWSEHLRDLTVTFYADLRPARALFQYN
jgi:hypothetical protein